MSTDVVVFEPCNLFSSSERILSTAVLNSKGLSSNAKHCLDAMSLAECQALAKGELARDDRFHHAPEARQECTRLVLACSTVGCMLATRLKCPFYEGDDYHPKANKGKCKQICVTATTVKKPNLLYGKSAADKMHSGIPLQDEDRWPWLQTLADIIYNHVSRYIKMCCHSCT